MTRPLRIFSAPTTVCLVLTDLCNMRCRHCLNYWRHAGDHRRTLTPEQVDRLAEIFAAAGVFHVTLSGGEPLCRADILEHAVKRFRETGITLGCNSNLALARRDRLERLREAGLDHFLTSLNSCDPETNDRLVGLPGAFARVVRGIGEAIEAGFRVSANMVVTRANRDQVAGTGRLAADLGCQRFFGTRAVPCINQEEGPESDLLAGREEVLAVLDQLLALQEERGIMVGSLVSYPLCLLGDLERYQAFVGRGCPSQAGTRININPTGETQPCPHSERSYGNIFADGLPAIWRRMAPWHEGAYRHAGCAGCAYLEVCGTGCRISSLVAGGRLDGPDPLMTGPAGIHRPYRLVPDPEFLARAERGLRFTVPPRIRWRREEGFDLLNIRWANTVTVPAGIGAFLRRMQAAGTPFTLRDFGPAEGELLAQLYFKDALESPDLAVGDRRALQGVSLNPEALRL